jgi:hypothetical protein
MAVQPFGEKYFTFAVGQITITSLHVPSRQRGARAIVTNAGRDAVDAEAPLTNGA